MMFVPIPCVHFSSSDLWRCQIIPPLFGLVTYEHWGFGKINSILIFSCMKWMRMIIVSFYWSFFHTVQLTIRYRPSSSTPSHYFSHELTLWCIYTLAVLRVFSFPLSHSPFIIPSVLIVIVLYLFISFPMCYMLSPDFYKQTIPKYNNQANSIDNVSSFGCSSRRHIKNCHP